VEIRVLTEAYAKATNALGSTWLTKDMTNFDIMRFSKVYKGDGDKTAKALIAHSKWRTEKHGAVEILARAAYFEKSPLNKEIFWLGPDKGGCPTIVVRSNFHDGKNYNDDPKEYADFFVYQIEKGRRLYGIGASRKGCVLVDRYAVNPEIVSGESNPFDLSFIPSMMATFKHLNTLVHSQFPDMLEEIMIVPSTWFSQTCWRILRSIVDKDTRDLFHMVGVNEVVPLMARKFHARQLPPYLGGSSDTYGGSCMFCSGPMNNRHGAIPALAKTDGKGNDKDQKDVTIACGMPGGGCESFASSGRKKAWGTLSSFKATWMASWDEMRQSSTQVESILTMDG
jgi:hypothetical protein